MAMHCTVWLAASVHGDPDCVTEGLNADTHELQSDAIAQKGPIVSYMNKCRPNTTTM